MKKKYNERKGLITLRKQTAKNPTYECSNCRCKRYSPCTCKKKENK